MWLPHILAAVKEAERLAWVNFKTRQSQLLSPRLHWLELRHVVQPNCKGGWEMETAYGPRKRKQELEQMKTLSEHRRKLIIIINYDIPL